MDMNFWLTAGISGLLGACTTGAWGILKDKSSHNAEARALHNGLLAEVKTLDHLMRSRRYRTDLEFVVAEMKKANSNNYRFSAYMGDGIGPVYKANVQKIGMLNEDFAADIIKFHAILYAISCDLHEKSVFQKHGYDVKTLESMIALFIEAEKVASGIIIRQ
ncbi:MAG: hypothetical protein KH310_24180 [Enterobacteriaceae bacterium]|nr:hypothetical protein [Enterobacteriaceae bacterium]